MNSSIMPIEDIKCIKKQSSDPKAVGEKRQRNNKGNKQKTNSNTVNNLNMSIVILNVNKLCTQNQRQRWSEWIKIPKFMMSSTVYFKYKKTDHLKVKGQEKICYV